MIPIFLMYVNNFAWTKTCIESIKKYTEDYHLILINNGSSEKTNELMEEFSDITQIEYKSPVGVSFAYNEAIKTYASREFFVIIHNDVVVTPNWLTKLVEGYQEASKKSFCNISAIYPRTNYSNTDFPTKYDFDLKKNTISSKLNNKMIFDLGQVDNTIRNIYKEFNGLNNYAKEVEEEFEDDPYCIADELESFCTLFHAVNFSKNFFCEDFIEAGGETKLFNIQSMNHLWFPAMSMNTFVHHNGNLTSDGFGKDFVFNSKKTEEILEKKKKEENIKIIKTVYQNTRLYSGDLNVLAVRDEGIGDIIMSLFALEGLKNVNRSIKITYATNPGFMKFVSKFSCVDSVIPINKTFLSKSIKTEKDIKELTKEYEKEYDVVFNLVRYFEDFNGLDATLEEDKHRSLLVYENIKTIMNSNIINKELKIVHPEYKFDRYDDLCKSKFFQDFTEDYVVIAPYGTCDIRSMPNEVFFSILEKESKKHGIVILNKDIIKDFPEQMDVNNILDLSGKTVLEDIPAILRKAKYVYTPDSGVFHIASVLGIPCRAFFGSILPETRGSYYKNAVQYYVRKELDCVPCYDKGCNSILCMKYSDEEIEKIVSGLPT